MVENKELYLQRIAAGLKLKRNIQAEVLACSGKLLGSMSPGQNSDSEVKGSGFRSNRNLRRIMQGGVKEYIYYLRNTYSISCARIENVTKLGRDIVYRK